MKTFIKIFVLLVGLYSLNATEYNNTEYNNNNLFQHSYINNDASVSMNKQTQVAKPQVPLTRFINKNIVDTILTEANVEAKCRQFIAMANIDVNNMQLLAAKFKQNQWYVNFAQTHNGIRLLDANTKLRIFENGNLLYVETEYFPEIAHRIDLHKIENIDTNAMKQVSIIGLEKDNPLKNISVEHLNFSFGEQYIIPVSTKKGTDFYLVQSVEFRNNFGNVAYKSYIDVKSHKLLLRYNLVYNADYKIQSKIIYPEPTAPLVETNYFPYMDVIIDDKTYSADANGVISTDEYYKWKRSTADF
ncbi:MAG: hypothetical protein FWG85_00720 [Bacteroidetes bacterium]|nr:hypothetical protein [Bacteroidota bacterium]